MIVREDNGATNVRVHQPFICPECGSSVATKGLYLSKVYPPVSQDPWAIVLHQVTCGACHWTIPAQLAFRWDMTLDEAQAQWRSVYRDTSPDQPE